MPAAANQLPIWAQVALILVPAVSAALAAFGLILNVVQVRRTNAQQRSALVATCLKDFADDEDIQRAFYSIEYDKFRYDSEFHESERERHMDKLLRHFANLALAWQAGLLTTRDVRPIQYYLFRIVRNEQVRKYLAFIGEWTDAARLGQHPFAVLLELGDRLQDEA